MAARRPPSSGALCAWKGPLSRGAGLSYARGLYAEGGGGMEGVLTSMTTEMRTSEPRPLELI